MPAVSVAAKRDECIVPERISTILSVFATSLEEVKPVSVREMTMVTPSLGSAAAAGKPVEEALVVCFRLNGTACFQMQECPGFLIRFDELERLLVIHSESCQECTERIAGTDLVFTRKKLFFTTQFFKLV